MGVSRLYRAGIAGTQGCEDDDDLHACDEPAGAERDQPAGPDRRGTLGGVSNDREITEALFCSPHLSPLPRYPLRGGEEEAADSFFPPIAKRPIACVSERAYGERALR